MATENIRINYEVTGKKELDAANKSLEQTAKANDVTQKEIDETNKKFEDQSNVSKKLTAERIKLLRTYKQASTELKQEALDFQILGTSVGRITLLFGKVKTATLLYTAVLGKLRIALISTGVGAIVVAFGSLIVFLTKTQAGTNIVNKSMAAIGATIDVLIDRVAKFGEGLFNIFSGNFTEGLELLKDSFKGITAEIINESKAAADLSDRYEALRLSEANLTVETRKRRAEIKGLNKDAEDTTLKEKQRFAAIDKAIKIENQLQKERIAIAQERLDIINAQKKLGNSLTDDIEEQAEAEAALFSIIEESDEMLTTLNNKRNILSNTIKDQKAATIALTEAEQKAVAEQKAAAIALTEAEQKAAFDAFAKGLEDQNRARETNFQRELDANIRLRLFRKEQDALNEEDDELRLEKLIEFEESKFAAIKNTTELTNDELILLEEQKNAKIESLNMSAAESQKRIDETVVENKRALRQKLLGQLIAFAGRESTLGKALALFEIGKNSAVGVSAAIKAGAGVPFPGNLIAIASGVSAVLGGILGAKEIIGSTPLPKFEKGGKIGGRRHSQGGTLIEAEIGEHMINRKATSFYGHNLFDKINNLELHPDILNGKSVGSNVFVIDNSDLAKEFRNRPENSIKIDANGFQSYQRRSNSLLIKKANRYSV